MGDPLNLTRMSKVPSESFKLADREFNEFSNYNVGNENNLAIEGPNKLSQSPMLHERNKVIQEKTPKLISNKPFVATNTQAH